MYIIDHSTTTAEAASHSGGNSGKGGDILYRWGNPAAYSGSGSSTLNVVHDAHWIPQGCPNAGYIVGFNNNGVSQQTSCVDMVNPPMIGNAYDVTPGTAILPTSYTIRQNCNGHTNNMGNSQQLPNGNMLICIAQSGTIYEIDPNGNTIWTKTVNGTVPQAFRYDACYVSGGVPATPVLSGDATLLTATGGTNYAWYLNGNLINGASGATWNPAQTGTGTYQVIALGNSNCNSSLSNGIDVVISSIDEQSLSEINVYPNPANDYVRFTIPSSPTGYYSYTLRNSLGQIVQSGNTTGSIPTADLSDGFYFIEMVSGAKHMTTRCIIQHNIR
jgi:hypothetical protein